MFEHNPLELLYPHRLCFLTRIQLMGREDGEGTEMGSNKDLICP